MTTKSTSILEPTAADGFEVGRREGLKEAFMEIQSMVAQGTPSETIKIYINARLKSIQDFTVTNPFKQKKDS